MISGVRGISIWSEDLRNLLPFYRDVIGLPISIETPGFVVLGDPGGPTLAIGTHSEVHGRTADPARHMVGLATDDIHGDWERLKRHGVEFIEEPNQQGTLWIATFKDPDGNFLQLLQPA